MSCGPTGCGGVPQPQGYDLVPHLAALFPDSLTFSDGSAARVRDDLYEVRGDLWTRSRLRR